jgi:asparagine synthase (glutamine-hydrolysing)
MQKSLDHRGPDSFDFYTKIIPDSDISLNFGHNRLAILDLSETGNQPMHSHSGRYTIVFNGEVYNFKELKSEIEIINPNVIWRGHSDTEILLECFELFGIQDCLKKITGMFAISLWDNYCKKLYLIRDRIGEKPLYYGYQNDQLLFASELKAFEVHSKFEKKINFNAAIGFLIKSYIPGFLSIYENIYKVKPGAILEFELGFISQKLEPIETFYWSLSEEVAKAQKNPYTDTYDNAKAELELLLIDAIKKQSVADVQLGAFLSGGIDSSLVCAIVKRHVKSDLLTFTIEMPHPGVNEGPHASSVATSINSIHNSRTINSSEILSRIDEIISLWDEPFGDSSQIPTFLVSEFAKEKVTVALSGDGADEFLFGYHDHRVYTKFRKFKIIAFLHLDILLIKLSKLIGMNNSLFFQKFQSLSYLLRLMIRHENIGIVHSNWHNVFWNKELPVVNIGSTVKENLLNQQSNYFQNVGHYDALEYLPNDILVKVDRAAMGVSLETRAPFLDHRILEFLFRLPLDFLYSKGISKRITKDILYKYVPEEVLNRPKQGFSIPIANWLRNDLKQWADNIITDIPSKSEFWNKSMVTEIWNEHLNGEIDHSEKLWNILVLELFFKRKKLLHYDLNKSMVA